MATPLYNNLLAAKTAVKPMWQSYVDQYAKPYKIPVEQIVDAVYLRLQDPYFYGTAILATAAWVHFVPFIGATVSGLYLTGIWDYVQENFPDPVKFVNNVIPLPLKTQNAPDSVNSFFANTVQKIHSQNNPDTKIITVALLFFFAWLTSYFAVAAGLMLGNHVWHKYNIQVPGQG